MPMDNLIDWLINEGGAGVWGCGDEGLIGAGFGPNLQGFGNLQLGFPNLQEFGISGNVGCPGIWHLQHHQIPGEAAPKKLPKDAGRVRPLPRQRWDRGGADLRRKFLVIHPKKPLQKLPKQAQKSPVKPPKKGQKKCKAPSPSPKSSEKVPKPVQKPKTLQKIPRKPHQKNHQITKKRPLEREQNPPKKPKP